MAEQIISPGVFTRENDLSFLPQGVGAIGAAIVGPTHKGPAFVPTQIRNFPEFEEMFGSTTKDYYTPYAVEQYLRSSGTVTVVRVLNTSGYTADYVDIFISGSGGTADLEGSAITGSWSSATLTLSGSNWGAKSLTSRDYTISFDT